MNPEDAPTNSVLAIKLDYISKDIGTIKKDISDIKADNIGRREFETHVKDSEDRVRARFLLSDQKIENVQQGFDERLRESQKGHEWNTKIIYGVLTLVLGTLVTAVMKAILK